MLKEYEYHKDENGLILNGDAIEIMPKLKLDNAIIITDPPFNINYKYNEHKDNMEEKEYLEMLDKVLLNYSFVIVHYPEYMFKIAQHKGIIPNRCVSWVYNSNTRRQWRMVSWFGKAYPNFSKVKGEYKNQKDKRIIDRMNRGLSPNLYD